MKKSTLNHYRLLILPLFVTLLNPQTSLAREGFFHNIESAPLGVKAAWDSTFMIFVRKDGMLQHGSGFLVKKVPSPKGIDLYFLTNEHVIRPTGCKDRKACKALSLIQNARQKITSNGVVITDVENELTGVEIVGRSKTPDLALLKVSLRQKSFGVRPIPMAQSCELSEKAKTYTIGFPWTPQRTAPDHLEISDQSQVFKRWSEGYFYEESVKEVGGVDGVYSFSSIDVLGGNSGGPYLDEAGMAIGVIKQGAGLDENLHKYTGADDPYFGASEWHAVAVPCHETKIFLEDFKIN